MLVTLKEILKDADEKKYGVGLFNFINFEMFKGIISAAEKQKSPLILGVAEVHLPLVQMDYAIHLMKKAARDLSVPVCLHLDHGFSKETIFSAIHSGFSSVMYDGSDLPYEENVANTIEVVNEAAKYGVAVEAELGRVGGSEDGRDTLAGQYTAPALVEDFIGRTHVDALAVAIGTAHGQYREKPVLDIQRLADIKKVSKVPLVLHGGSGLSDDDFRNTIQNGISKINIFTDVAVSAIKDRTGNTCEELVESAAKRAEEVVVRKMQLFGSAGKSWT